jgi:two-component system, NarL family, nitrate/nitrite response regulator NarL
MNTVTDKIKVFLVDDHHIVRSGIRSELSKNENISILGEASSGKDALEKLEKMIPDVILMDISMPEMNGLKATELIKKKMPNVKIIALTMHDNKNYVAELIRLGASGYIMKDSSPEELIKAIESVYNDILYFSPKINVDLIKSTPRTPRASKAHLPGSLTPREESILRFLVNGLSNKEIAKELAISVRTVETHREHINRKLNMKSLAELTKYAIAEGIIDMA